jgi:hypothetical protein
MFSALLKTKVLSACAAASALLLFAGLVAIVASHGRLTPPLALHLGPNGADLFGSIRGLYAIWALGATIAATNTFLGIRLYRTLRPFTYLLFGTTALIAALLLGVIGTIVRLN